MTAQRRFEPSLTFLRPTLRLGNQRQWATFDAATPFAGESLPGRADDKSRVRPPGVLGELKRASRSQAVLRLPRRSRRPVSWRRRALDRTQVHRDGYHFGRIESRPCCRSLLAKSVEECGFRSPIVRENHAVPST